MKRAMMLMASILIVSQTFAQTFFERNDDVDVIKDGTPLLHPWAGGLNNPEFSNIDLNGDAIQDLFIFDKAGNKIITYLGNGTPDAVDFNLAPRYRSMFINQHSELRGLHDWVLLKDFNCDGKADIFTYSSGGMAVYRNDSQGDTLIWTLMTDLLESINGDDTNNIYVSPVDLPAIDDADGDGDVDIITFSFSGVSANLHKNMSMENFGHCDSLKYVVSDPCWGQFEEDPSTINVSLGISCKGELEVPPPGTTTRVVAHSGFTLMPIDIESDGDLDMVISNVTFDKMNLLHNGGTVADANITSQDVDFPANNLNTDAIDIYTFPAGFKADVNNDGRDDILATSFQENNGEDHNGVWYYENIGIGAAQVFERQQTDFLQGEMIDLGTSAYPVFVELSGDTLLDLLVGNHGYFESIGNYDGRLAYYQNTGTSTQPEFTLINDDYVNVSTLNLNSITPTFGDIDDDGDEDMIIGDATGVVHLFTNSGGAGNPASLALTEPGYQGINTQQGQFATPFLFDVDDDQDLDLILGERSGNLNFYENQGTPAAADFILVDEDFGSVNTNAPFVTFGYSAPFMYESNGEKRLLVGAENGDMEMFAGIEPILSAPLVVEEPVGVASQTSSGWEETPFGFDKRSGRNQMLIKASELEAAGFIQGLIQKVTFTTLSGIETPTGSVRVRLKSTELTSLNSLLPPSEMTTVFTSTGFFYSPGLLEFNFATPFIWDGNSNLIVEVCYAHAFSSAENMDIQLVNTGFDSNAYGGSELTSDGCNTPYNGVSQMRPLMTLSIKPGFESLGNLTAFEGERIALNGADVDNDGLMDLVIGNLAGGLSYYSGSTSGVGPDAIFANEKPIDLRIYPNPNSGDFYLEINEMGRTSGDFILFDLVGNEVFRKSGIGDGKHQIDVSDLAKGMYVSIVKSEDRAVYKRLIIH